MGAVTFMGVRPTIWHDAGKIVPCYAEVPVRLAQTEAPQQHLWSLARLNPRARPSISHG